MSSVVVLEGNVQKPSSPDDAVDHSLLWQGHWRFVKDKKGTLQFNYTVRKIWFLLPFVLIFVF
jgi:hypothetical protein